MFLSLTIDPDLETGPTVGLCWNGLVKGQMGTPESWAFLSLTTGPDLETGPTVGLRRNGLVEGQVGTPESWA